MGTPTSSLWLDRKCTSPGIQLVTEPSNRKRSSMRSFCLGCLFFLSFFFCVFFKAHPSLGCYLWVFFLFSYFFFFFFSFLHNYPLGFDAENREDDERQRGRVVERCLLTITGRILCVWMCVRVCVWGICIIHHCQHCLLNYLKCHSNTPNTHVNRKLFTAFLKRFVCQITYWKTQICVPATLEIKSNPGDFKLLPANINKDHIRMGLRHEVTSHSIWLGTFLRCWSVWSLLCFTWILQPEKEAEQAAGKITTTRYISHIMNKNYTETVFMKIVLYKMEFL